MHDIFLFGTLCHRPLLEVIAGETVAISGARMPGVEVVWVAGKSWPMLQDRTGAMAEGLLIRVSDRALARLDFYEACFDYARAPVTVETAAGLRQVEAWLPLTQHGEPGAVWSLADWVARWAAISVRAAQEVMRQSQTADPRSIGRRFWMIRARAQAQVLAGDWRRPALVGRGHGRNDVTIQDRRFPYDAFFGVEELRLTARQFNGRQSSLQERAVFKVADAVTVLPYDPVRDRILLVEQLRFGAFVQGDAAPWLLEPVAGIIDAGETAETSARREAVEEAGLTLGDLHFVAKYYPSPGGIAQVISSYVAIADLPDGITGINGADDEGEDILSHLVSYETACRMLGGGDMANAPLILSFQWLQMHRDRLRAAG